MSVKSINATNVNGTPNNVKKQQNQTSFKGSLNPVVPVMDAIDRGGFAASFIAQDFIGMVAPRIGEGLNRRPVDEETGKKTGPLNWEFARREGIREILSGPSAFLIPAGILAIIKKTSGTANNVPVDHIQAYSELFAQTAKNHVGDLKNSKQEFYESVFKNALATSSSNDIQPEEIEKISKDFATRLVDIDNTTKKKNFFQKLFGTALEGSREEKIDKLIDDYKSLLKQHISGTENEAGFKIALKDNKTLNTTIHKFVNSANDYTQDVIKSTEKNLKNNSNIEECIKKFANHRSGTRVLSNFGMWSAVVAFYTLIPKLYNIGLKKDPGIVDDIKAGSKQTTNEQNKDVSFTGGFQSLGKACSKNDSLLGKIASNFEFNGASMSVPAMLTLLFGFCLPPRYLNAKSDYEKKEILVRDIASFTAILFGAKALSRASSKLFTKISGLALTTDPADHNKSFLHKLKNYFTAGSGVNVLTSEQIISKYSSIDGYKGGISGFFEFLESNGGNIKKVLKIDKDVLENSKEIMKNFGNNKSLENATIDEIKAAFKNAKGSEALENIYQVFSNKSNKFINRAKTMNSAFGFASTLVLVPAFMMWLARHCEAMTKKSRAKEAALLAEQNNNSQTNSSQPNNVTTTNKPTMAGFLNK